MLNQLQMGLEADQIYYQTGPNGKRGIAKVLNEAKLFKLKTIWQVKKPNPASNRFSALSQTESVEQISGVEQSDADDERITLERFHRPLQQHTSSRELVAYFNSDTDFPSIAIREALPFTWYEGNPNPQVIDKPTVVETSKWTKITMVKACEAFGVNATGFEHDLLDLVLRMEQRRQKQVQKLELN